MLYRFETTILFTKATAASVTAAAAVAAAAAAAAARRLRSYRFMAAIALCFRRKVYASRLFYI